MNELFVEELNRLFKCFPDAYINNDLELILIPKTNTYFSLVGCSTTKDIIAKVLMYCTNDIANARPYKYQSKNVSFYIDNHNRLEKYLGVMLNVGVIYQCLGNGINKELTDKFIYSGFNMEILYTYIEEKQNER